MGPAHLQKPLDNKITYLELGDVCLNGFPGDSPELLRPNHPLPCDSLSNQPRATKTNFPFPKGGKARLSARRIMKKPAAKAKTTIKKDDYVRHGIKTTRCRGRESSGTARSMISIMQRTAISSYICCLKTDDGRHNLFQGWQLTYGPKGRKGDA